MSTPGRNDLCPWEEFFVWHDVPGNLDDCREFGTTFDPFFVFAFVPDSADADLPEGWPTEPLARHFLHHEVDSCPPFHREFIAQACQSPASFFVIEATAPGRSIDLKDVLTGTRFHVLEQSASRTFQPGDLTYTRVVTAGDASIMIGAAPWIIPPAWHVHIIDMRDHLGRRRLMTRADLVDNDIEIRDQYHHIAEALANPRPGWRLPRAVPNVDHAHRANCAIDREEGPIRMRFSAVVKHANRIGRIETLRSDRAAMRMTVERENGPFESVEPSRAPMWSLIGHPTIELFEVGLGALRDLNAESHACDATDRRPDVQA